MTDIEELRNEIQVEAAGSDDFEIAAFAHVFARRLEEAEQVYDLNVELLRCSGPYGRRLELLGYAEDPTEGSLILLAGRYFGDDTRLAGADAREVLGRATDFIENSANGWLSENLEVSSRESEYADYFASRILGRHVSKMRAILITDGVMSDRIKSIESGVVAGLRTSYEIWDQRRVLDAAIPERGSEDISIDFTAWLPDGLPCLVADTSDPTTTTYLSVIPGRVLAEVFDEFGSLLLESNVRTFLSARGAVNRGIQATLAQEPDRFLAYNNGLTTTSTGVELIPTAKGEAIKRIERWQIVNGGQTTASIAHFLRSGRDRNVDDVYVQMKIVTVSEERAAEVVQAVAKYANSQNRVSGADLFATHEFHVRMEQISRRLRAPAKEGQQYQTGWYYERARGQWENDRAARGTPAGQRKFELEFPKSQRVTKTDWAKYAYCWGKKPHLVSKGAQSVFAEYAIQVDAQWEKSSDDFGDAYFRNNIGKAIMFETLRTAVLKSDWYVASPGYLANIVAYAMSRFSSQIEQQFAQLRYDWATVWQRQAISAGSLAALLDFAHAAQRHLTDPARPQANVTQWAKQLTAWERFREIPLSLPREIEPDLVGSAQATTQAVDDRRQRALDTAFEDVARVVRVPPATWMTIYSAGANVSMSPVEKDLMRLFGLNDQKRVPSERQAGVLMRLLERMAASGVIRRDSF